MSAIRSILTLLGLHPETPCAKSLAVEESKPVADPVFAEETPEEIRHQWRDAVHKNRNLQQTGIQLARRSTRGWNNAESMAAKAIAEIQRRRGDEDQ